MNLRESSIMFAQWIAGNDENQNQTTEDQIVEGGLLRISKNDEIASMMLIQEIEEYAETDNDMSFFREVKRIAFINGEVDQLKKLIKKYKIKVGSDHNALFGDFKIVIHEVLADQLPDDEHDGGFNEKINPESGEVLTKDGKDIYRKTKLVHSSKGINDILIAHDRETAPKVAKDSSADFKEAPEETPETPEAKPEPKGKK